LNGEASDENSKKQALESLMWFWLGFFFKCEIDAWERWKERNFFENFNEIINSMPVPIDPNFFHKFNKFVHSHYGRIGSGHTALMLIAKNTDSEKEAFYKFLELFDEYIKQHSDSTP